MVEVGDVIEVATCKIGQAVRKGTVKAVHGPLLAVAWDSGEQTSLISAAGSVSVVGSARSRAAKRDPATKSAPSSGAKKTGSATKKGKGGAKGDNRR
jgi:hypothetical protein